jgi:DNA-binding transcriptional MerR regulator
MAELPAKLFFRIGEVAGLVGVEPHVLRYWEREFRSIRPTKSAKGQRVYSRKDVENLLRVRDLLYREGFTIAGAKKKLSRPEALHDATPPSGEREALEEMDDGEDVELPARPSEPAPFPRGDGRVREKLSALRAEVESFLDELTRTRGPDRNADVLRRRG